MADRRAAMSKYWKMKMSELFREYLGSCECRSDDGCHAVVSSYRIAGKAGLQIVHRAQDMSIAIWCAVSRVFILGRAGKHYRPIDPVPHLAFGIV